MKAESSWLIPRKPIVNLEILIVVISQYTNHHIWA